MCSSLGQTVHGLICGACVHGVEWVHGGVMVMGNSLWLVICLLGSERNL